mgnify:CR=1 FL=1
MQLHEISQSLQAFGVYACMMMRSMMMMISIIIIISRHRHHHHHDHDDDYQEVGLLTVIWSW